MARKHIRSLLSGKEIPAFSLVEVVVASVIVSLSFTLFLASFLNISVTASTLRDHQFGSAIDQVFIALQNEPLYPGKKDVVTSTGVKVTKAIEIYRDIPGLFMVKLTIADTSTHKQKEQKALIYRP